MNQGSRILAAAQITDEQDTLGTDGCAISQHHWERLGAIRAGPVTCVLSVHQGQQQVRSLNPRLTLPWHFRFKFAFGGGRACPWPSWEAVVGWPFRRE
jgi:hypothetical protein